METLIEISTMIYKTLAITNKPFTVDIQFFYDPIILRRCNVEPK